MGRLVRRFIRCHRITVTSKVTLDRTVAVAITENIVGGRNLITVNAAVTGYVYGLYPQIELSANVSGGISGIRIGIGADAGLTLAGALYPIYVNNYVQTQPGLDYCFMRLSENGGVTVHSGILMTIGGGGDMDYAFQFSGTPITAWDGFLLAPGAQQGRIAVLAHSEPRYIRLYEQ